MRRRFTEAAVLCSTLALLTGCMAKAPNAQIGQSAPSVKTGGSDVLGLVTDQLEAGFNPHSAGDRTLTTDIVASLTLPSVFLPRPTEGTTSQTAVVDSTTWILNEALVRSAKVTSEEPFQVTYQIQPGAQWGGSPPVPVEARDFSYLWRVMMNAPEIDTTAGYDLITSVEGKGDGKTVVVTFSRVYAQWRTLFQHLLPSQFLNDIPGLSQLQQTIPFSAGAATVRSVDLERGQITLMPNDKFVTGARMASDSIRIQRQNTSDQIAEGLRSESVQAGYAQGDSLTPTRLNAVPGVSATYVWRPRQLALSINAASSLVGGQPAVSRALLSLIDVRLVAQLAANRLSSVASGDVPAVAVPRVITVPPQRAGVYPVSPTERELATQGIEVLHNAGWVRHDRRLTTPQGHNRAIVIGTVRGDVEALAAATAIADQLSQAGFPAIVQDTRAADLYGFWLPRGKVDLVLGWHTTDQSVIASVSSRFHCTTGDAVRSAPARIQSAQLDPLASSAAGNDYRRKEISAQIAAAKDHQGVDPQTGSTLQALRAEYDAAPTEEAGNHADQPLTRHVQQGSRGANASGTCDPELQTLVGDMRRVTDSQPPTAQVALAKPFLHKIEQRLWELGLVLPIWQETLLEARGTRISNPTRELLGTPSLGFFYNVSQWTVTPTEQEKAAQ